MECKKIHQNLYMSPFFVDRDDNVVFYNSLNFILTDESLINYHNFWQKEEILKDIDVDFYKKSYDFDLSRYSSSKQELEKYVEYVITIPRSCDIMANFEVMNAPSSSIIEIRIFGAIFKSHYCNGKHVFFDFTVDNPLFIYFIQYHSTDLHVFVDRHEKNIYNVKMNFIAGHIKNRNDFMCSTIVSGLTNMRPCIVCSGMMGFYKFSDYPKDLRDSGQVTRQNNDFHTSHIEKIINSTIETEIIDDKNKINHLQYFYDNNKNYVNIKPSEKLGFVGEKSNPVVFQEELLFKPPCLNNKFSGGY